MYKGKVDFEIKKAQDEDAKALMIEHFPVNQHGLIAFGSDGKVAGTLPGHRFGKAKIVKLIDGLN